MYIAFSMFGKKQTNINNQKNPLGKQFRIQLCVITQKTKQHQKEVERLSGGDLPITIIFNLTLVHWFIGMEFLPIRNGFYVTLSIGFGYVEQAI